MPASQSRPDVRPAVGDERQVLQRRAQDLAHDRHGLAPRAPAADPDRHAVAQLGDGGGVGRALVHSVPRSRAEAEPRGRCARAEYNNETYRIATIPEYRPTWRRCATGGRWPGWRSEEPERVAVIHGDERATRLELERALEPAGARLRRARASAPGDARHDRAPERHRVPARRRLAVWKLGGSPQPVSARLPEAERRAIVELAQPALIVGAPGGEYARPLPSVPAGFEPEPSAVRRAAPRRGAAARAHHDLGRQHRAARS